MRENRSVSEVGDLPPPRRLSKASKSYDVGGDASETGSRSGGNAPGRFRALRRQTSLGTFTPGKMSRGGHPRAGGGGGGGDAEAADKLFPLPLNKDFSLDQAKFKRGAWRRGVVASWRCGGARQ